MAKIDETNSGLKVEGSWDDITEFCLKLEKIFEKYISDEDEIERYDQWRPKNDENEEDVQEKTAEDASIERNHIEEEFEGTEKELEDAEEKIKESFDDISHGKSPVEDLEEAFKDIEILVGAKSLESLRKIEETIYKNLMLKFNPCYFDTEDFSLSLNHKKDESYIFCVNISDENLRTHIQEELY